MEDDIKAQSKIIASLIKKHVTNYCVMIDVPLRINKIVIIASGSSYNAALYGKYFMEEIAQVETSIEFASEFSQSKFYNYDVDALYIFISQSGNSYDVVRSIEKVKQRGAKTLCLTNNSESKLYELSDFKILIDADKENAIAATKTFSATVFMIWLLAIKIGQNKHLDVSQETKNINSIKKCIESTLKDVENLKLAAKILSREKNFALVGFGTNYPLAREAALKIKEINYIHTSFYPMGEFIHGHFALLNKSETLFSVLTEEVSEEEKKLMNKILSTYKVKSILLTDEYEDYNCDLLLKFPKCNSKIATILCSIVTIQLLTLEIAKILKRNPDKPKGLSKVVENKKD